MVNSHIQWTDHTWNIARGCTKVDADCKFCYMMRDGDRYKYDGKVVIRTKGVFKLPLRIKEPARIFTSSLTDVFHPAIDGYRNEMWEIIRACPQHTFQILTKRPERIKEHLPKDWGAGWYNVWMGTSIGSQASEHRIDQLLKVPARTRFLSIEPLHGPLVIHSGHIDTARFWELGVLHWIIIGGESGNDTGKWRYRPCNIHWIESLVDQCQALNVPVFVKQLGTHLAKEMGLKDRNGGDINEWPKHLQVRQFPQMPVRGSIQDRIINNGDPLI